MFRYSSSSSISPFRSPAPSSPAPGLAAPTDPLPVQGTRPSDILLSRCHEVKRISKSLAAYFDGQFSFPARHLAVSYRSIPSDASFLRILFASHHAPF